MRSQSWQTTRVVAGAVLSLLLAASALAQFGGFRGPFIVRPNIHYDGRFTLVRLKYTTAPGGFWYGGCAAGGARHPQAETNLTRIKNEVKLLRAQTEENNTLTLDGPALLGYHAASTL